MNGTHAPSMLDLIATKRNGGSHSLREIEWLIEQIVLDQVPDYQLAAWLMAVVCRGMTPDETRALTAAMAESGDILDLSDLPGVVADKHSTGGVGDKTSLVVGPLAAATGLNVAKMSGRGLGHTGGTLDKLESIPGLSVDIDIRGFRAQAKRIGLVIAGQTADLAPADKRLYTLRDVTGTVPSLPLIAASIMSKKIAAGAMTIVLDVKVGCGAFLKHRSDAAELARAMIDLGRHAGRNVAAQLSRMDQPLGNAVGNALEVREAVRTLQGDGPDDLRLLALRLVALMHAESGTVSTGNEIMPVLEQALQSGAALAKLEQMVAAQGGRAEALTDDRLLPSAPEVHPVPAPRSGYVSSLDALEVGLVAVDLGAGRKVKDQAVDHSVGVELRAKVGAKVRAGETLALVHATSHASAEVAACRLAGAYGLGDGPPAQQPLLIDTIR